MRKVEELNVEAIRQAVIELEEAKIGESVRKALDANIKPLEIIEALRSGLEVVGERYAKGDYFLSELIVSGEIMKRALKILEPHLASAKIEKRGKIVLGSALGDMHDIGKNIVKTLLISSGFEVYDLGIDVPPKKFAKKVEETGASIVGISALLSTTVPIAAEVVKELEKAGLREKVKVIMGGAAVRKSMIEAFGVDAAVNDVIEGINTIKSWVS
jgi:5-methyltetrahydrofolate--homocysteine methyltransferase